MNVHLACMFHEVTQQVAMPAKKRTMTTKLLCQSLGVEMGKFDSVPNLQEIGSKISINYPADVLGLILARKATARVGASSFGNNVDVLIALESTATKLESQISPLPAPVEHRPVEPSLAIGK